MDLLAKLQGLADRHDRMKALGFEGISVLNERVLSPTRAIIDGRETILAGTNNYMGITFDPDCIAAGKKALDEFGTGTTGSRIANGSFSLHAELELEFARFLDRKHCIVFTTGYQANLGMMSGLAGPRDTIYLDADSHSSIYDGCTLSGAKLVRFRHNDAADLDKRLSRGEEDGGGKLVVLEGIYSMLGDRAPLADFIEVKKKHGFQLLVDEAHSFGVLGPHGRGLADEAGLEKDVDFVVGHLFQERWRHRRLRRRRPSAVRLSALCDAALHVHGVFLARFNRDLDCSGAQACGGAAAPPEAARQFGPPLRGLPQPRPRTRLRYGESGDRGTLSGRALDGGDVERAAACRRLCQHRAAAGHAEQALPAALLGLRRA